MFKYDIHRIVRIVSDLPIVPEYFQVDKIDNPDLVIKEIDDIRVNESELNKIGLSFYGENDIFFFKSPILPKLAVKVLIKDIYGKETELLYNKLALIVQEAGRLARKFSVKGLAGMLFELKLLQRGYVSVHAAGMEKEGDAYLMSAWSETGKTSTILGLSSRGSNLLGDDRVIISKQGDALCYPSDVGLFFHTKNIRKIDLPLHKRIKIRMKYLLSKIRLLDILFSATEGVKLSEIGEVADRGKVKQVFLLEMGREKVKEITLEEAINRIMASMDVSFRSHMDYRTFLPAIRYLNPKDSFSPEKKTRKILQEGLKEATYFLIRGQKEKFPKLIKNIIETEG